MARTFSQARLGPAIGLSPTVDEHVRAHALAPLQDSRSRRRPDNDGTLRFDQEGTFSAALSVRGLAKGQTVK